MITTIKEYRGFLDYLGGELSDLINTVPKGDRRTIMLKLAAKMDLSFNTIVNYVGGKISDPERAFEMIENLKEIINDK